MNAQLQAQLEEIRGRAHSVLDGMTKHREQVARDALALCSAIERMDQALAKQQPAGGTPFTGLFGDIFGGKRR
jgi:hypothetical protein